MGSVEELLDSCHALQNYGVDRYRRPSKLSFAEETARRKERLAHGMGARWRADLEGDAGDL